ncbi:hypothetical protein [Umezawaea sp.]|uniref:hypothetical protein n=1 Tax=Umezawaea sp. TaxID=1955258 RepID=UPI002ED29529
MSVEEELRDTLAERARHASAVDGLAETVVRRVRRGRQRASVAGAALVVGAGLVGGAVVSGTGGVRTATSTSAAPSSGAPASNTAVPALVGRWEPVSITGFDLSGADRGSDTRAPAVEFGRDGTGSVADGCNSASLAYRVEPGGGFSAWLGPSTVVRCSNVPNDRVLDEAVRIGISGELLTFYDGAGGELGRYARKAGQP